MEHVVVDLAPGRQRAMPVPAAAQPDRDQAGRQSLRRSRRYASTGRAVRNRQQAVRLRADMREFEAALARWAR